MILWQPGVGHAGDYHQVGTLHDFYELYGPDGSNEVMVFMIEVDGNTTMEDLMGTGGATIGDWITGTNYPIIEDSNVGSLYQISFVPTLLKICPDRTIHAFSYSDSIEELAVNMNSCASYSSLLPTSEFYSDYRHGCNTRTVQFTDDTWPIAESRIWNFGDGSSSIEVNPIHTYEVPGTYEVSLTSYNDMGSDTKVKPEFVIIGDGIAEFDAENIGLENNLTGFSTLSIQGNHGLKFDVFNPMILSSVKVYSGLEDERIVTLRDSSGILLYRKEVSIPEGEHIVNLDFYIPSGVGYRIGFQSNANLFYNTSGFTFPYVVDDLLSITGRHALI